MKSANALMIENPALATDRGILARMAPLGLGSPDFDPDKFSAAEAAEIEAGIQEGSKLSRSVGFGGKQIGGPLLKSRSRFNESSSSSTR